MKTGIIASLVLSIALVGSAAVVRHSSSSSKNAGLTIEAVEGAAEDISLDEFFDTATEPSNTAKAPAEISETDKISRQLFTEYLSLSSNNKTSSENLAYLAEKYAAALSNGEVNAKKTALSELTLGADTSESILSYSQAVTNLRSKYGTRVSNYEKGVDFTNIESESFLHFMELVGKSYESSARELIGIKVPQSLAQNHLELINNYQQIAASASVISKMKSDPLLAYLALNTLAKNSDRETALLQNIQFALLTSSGMRPQGI